MDFTYDEEHEAVRELAARIFSERATHERLREVEAAAAALDSVGPFDRELWTALAEAGLLGIALGEDVGGAGLDFLAACLVMEAAGTTAAHVPVLETLVYGAAAIDRFGTADQRQIWLTKVAAGETVLTAALAELAGDLVVPTGDVPLATALPVSGGGWKLSGSKACVPAGLVADAVLVPAVVGAAGGSSAGQVGVWIVPTGAAGLVVTRQDGPYVPEALLEFSGVEVGEDALLGGTTRSAGEESIVEWITERATTALCVLEAGATASAVALISEYTKTREQFDKPIATFQAVGQRAADAYVDTEAIRLTAWQAVWRLNEGLAAVPEIAVAKYWAAEGGQRVVHAAAHLHGGVGVDRDYPLHRYFLLTRQIELTLGGAQASLGRLGSYLASTPV